jgi:DNA repair protein RadA/Sms
VEDIIATLGQGPPAALAIIDSIQTMWTETVESAPGTSPRARQRPGADSASPRPPALR